MDRSYTSTSQTSLLSPQSNGSWMPIDTDIHWVWHNPLNLLIALPFLLLLLAIIF